MTARRACAPALAAAVAVLAICVSGCGGGGGPAHAVRNDAGIEVRPFSGAKVDVPQRPIAIAFGEGGVWVASMAGSVLTEIDPRSARKIGKPVFTDASPYALDVAFGKVWVAGFQNDVLVRVDPRTRKVIDRVKVDNRPFGLTHGFGHMWVTSVRGQTLSRLDPRTGRPDGPRVALSGTPYRVTAGGGYVWVANIRDGRVDKVDPRALKVVASFKTGGLPTALAYAHGLLWVACARDTSGDAGPSAETSSGQHVAPSSVWRIDPRSGRRLGVPVRVPLRPQAMAADARNVWVVSVDADTLLRIDARTGRPDALPVGIGDGPTDLALAPGAVWVTASRDDVAARYFGPR